MREFLLLPLLLIIFPASAAATVMVEVSIEDMARDADVIVVARVIRTEVRVIIDPVHGAEPHTLTELAVRDWIVGPGGARVVIDELGGEIQGEGLVIAGTPVYQPGTEVIVFLERAGGRLRTYAMAQGRFEIRRGVAGVPDHVVRDLSGVAFATWTGGRMRVGPGLGAAVELSVFVDYVRQIAQRYPLHAPSGGGLSR